MMIRAIPITYSVPQKKKMREKKKHHLLMSKTKLPKNKFRHKSLKSCDCFPQDFFQFQHLANTNREDQKYLATLKYLIMADITVLNLTMFIIIPNNVVLNIVRKTLWTMRAKLCCDQNICIIQNKR